MPLFVEINFDGVEGREYLRGRESKGGREAARLPWGGRASRFFQTFRHPDLNAESRASKGRALEYHFDFRNEVTTLPGLINGRRQFGRDKARARARALI